MAAPVQQAMAFNNLTSAFCRPRGLMDKASDFGSEDCEFESRRGQHFSVISNESALCHVDLYQGACRPDVTTKMTSEDLSHTPEIQVLVTIHFFVHGIYYSDTFQYSY